ncbi:MAG TPA: hypothetical protein VES67_01400 [Vicinamibacterales bacterium]|nr:hypothetical protein [Vicinamibacterales bacterium]
MAELWSEPEPGRDLFYGVGGKRLAPDPERKYTVIDIKGAGFSEGYTLQDNDKREWSAKLPPEAHSEVVASRIHWAIGYHQPPMYLLPKWDANTATPKSALLPARFREKNPDLNGLEDQGDWSYYQNPFVGTRQLNGLLVLQVMLGNSDLKDANNALYTLKTPLEGARQWYVARDLGQTFGRSGTLNAPRNDVQAFETSPFIRGLANGKVQFDYKGRHLALFENITAADVRWICERLNRLTDRQWQDAFRAAGYERDVADRFIKRLKAKVAEGLALKG